MGAVQQKLCSIYCGTFLDRFQRTTQPEVESRTQGSRPRTAFPRTDTLEVKDTSASALQKKKKRSSQKFFRRSPQKNVFQNIFQAFRKILTIQKIVLSSWPRTSSRTPPLNATDFPLLHWFELGGSL